MLTIGYDAKRAFNNASGLGNYSRLLVESMVKYHPENNYLLFTPKIGQTWQRWQAQMQESGVSSFLPPRRLQRIFHSYWRSVGIGKQAPAKGIQIYHGLSHELPIGMSKRGIKTVVTMHDLIFLRYPEYFPRIDRFIYERKFKQACQDADAIVSISEQTTEDLVQFLKADPKKIQLIYQDCHPIFRRAVTVGELAAFKTNHAITAPYIYVAGSFEKRKNHLRVLEAYAQLPADRPQLVFAGKKTAYLQDMLKLANKLEIAGEIRFLHNLSFEQLPALYAGAVFTAYLSEFEGFGLPVLESMAVGTPVLTSNLSSMPEVGGSAALYAPPSDVEAMAMQMRLLLFDEEKKAELTQQLQIQADRFSAENMANQLNALYNAL